MLLAALIGLAHADQRDVLVLHTADPLLVEPFRIRLARAGFLHDTDPWDLRVQGVPSAADLAPFGAVLLWLDAPPDDRDLLGDRLADFVDLNGGGLVLAGGSCANEGSPGGRLASDDLLPWNPGQLAGSSGQRAVVLGPDHDLHGALGVVDAGSSPRCVGLVPGGPVPLGWDDGAPLVALHPSLRVAGLNLWPPDTGSTPDGWVTDGHGEQVFARTLLWAAGWDWPAWGCRRDTADPDRNCNGILRPDEALVDLSDPACAASVGADGLPLPSFDDYVEPTLLGCEVPIWPENDWDVDGLGDGRVIQFVAPYLWWGEWTLFCDDCFDDPDPLQFDLDCDGVGDLCDPCPYAANGLLDTDYDGIPDDCDSCDLVPNPTQDNEDRDPRGNACDLCPLVDDPPDQDRDGDEIGDACDPCPDLAGDAADADADGLGDLCDLCPGTADADQSDLDLDLVGDACDVCPLDGSDGKLQPDADRDGVGDVCDTCPALGGAPQTDSDEDGAGDACDPCPEDADEHPGDRDGDAVPDTCDLCVTIPNPHQRDVDRDGVGDLCDKCPDAWDPEQLDGDADGRGDECDLVAIRGGGSLCSGARGCDGSGGGGLFGTTLGLALVLRRRRPSDEDRARSRERRRSEDGSTGGRIRLS